MSEVQIQIQLEMNGNNHNKSRLKIFRKLCKESKYIEIYKLIRLSDCIIFKRLCFDYACKHGYIDIAQWIFNNYFVDYSSNEYFSEYLYGLLYHVCDNGHLEIAKWLVQIKPDIFQNDYISHFNLACKKGYFHIAQWICEIIKKMGKKIDISSSFHSALNDKQYRVAKWLIDLAISDTLQINVLLEYAFHLAKKDFDIEIIQLVQLYRPFMYCERDEEYELENGSLSLRFSRADDVLHILYYNENNSIPNEINDKTHYRAIEEKMYFIPRGSEISLKEAVMRERFHPKNIDKWISWGHYNVEDFEY
jgi:hypothetical protein